jgi:hypothetical protein
MRDGGTDRAQFHTAAESDRLVAAGYCEMG